MGLQNTLSQQVAYFAVTPISAVPFYMDGSLKTSLDLKSCAEEYVYRRDPKLIRFWNFSSFLNESTKGR
jgi:hypothetical protein